MTPDKFTALVLALRGVGNEMGIYPGAVKGFGAEKDYEQRDGFKNGWNAAIIEYGQAFSTAVERAAAGMSDDVVMLLAADMGEMRADGTFLIYFNDVWAWATADAEIVQPDELKEVARLFRKWGFAGLMYWATTKHDGMRSEFKDNNRFIDFIAREEAFAKAEPNDSKRAYMDLPHT